MRYGLSGSRRVRAIHYQLGAKPAPKNWRQKRVGWFGRLMVGAMAMMFLGMTFGMRTSLLASLDVQYSQEQAPEPAASAQSTVEKPKLAQGIVNLPQAIDQWGKEHKDQKWGIVVKSLDGPSFEAALNSEQTFSADGLYRPYILLPLYNQMKFEKQQQTLVTVSGAKKAMTKCVDLMLRIADNNCGVAVGNYLNPYRANTLYKQAGYTQTKFGPSITSVTTSAKDFAFLLANINGSMLDPAGQRLVVDSMANQIFRNGIPAGCPGCTMANVSGFAGDIVYDAAIVNYSQGKYVIAAFSEGGGFEDMATLGGIVHQRILDSIK